LIADFRQPAALLQQLTQSALTPAATQQSANLYVAQNELFHFVLSAQTTSGTSRGSGGDGQDNEDDQENESDQENEDHPGASSGQGTSVEMTITDSQGHKVFDLITLSGTPLNGGSTLLAPGAYTVQFVELYPNGGTPSTMTYTLGAVCLADPIGPIPEGPNQGSPYTNPSDPNNYYYPGGIVSPVPYALVALAV
jgi:hypothetical protein